MGKPTNFSIYWHKWISTCWLLFGYRVLTPFPFYHVWGGVSNGEHLQVSIMMKGDVILSGFSTIDPNGDSTY